MFDEMTDFLSRGRLLSGKTEIILLSQGETKSPESRDLCGQVCELV